MLDLFNDLMLTERDIANLTNRECIRSRRRETHMGPPTVILHPGLLLAVLVRNISDPNLHSIRYFVPQTPFVRIGEANDASYFDMMTTQRAFDVLNEMDVLDRCDHTDLRGRRVWVLNTTGRRAYAKWQRFVREHEEHAHVAA